VGLLLISGWAAMHASLVSAQEIDRKIKSKVLPEYPTLAKHMNLVGTVRVQITVATNGTVKNAKLVGGHPILANPALEAVRKWRYEAAAQESTGVVEIRFDPPK
jgi:TonB family protein